MEATLEQFRDLINESNDWDSKFEQIIEEHGWTNECHTTWGVCSTETQRLQINENGDAEIVDISSTT